MDDPAGVQHALGDRRGVIRDHAPHRERAVLPRQPLDGDLVLHRDREPFERATLVAVREPFGGGARLVQRGVEVRVGERVDGRLDRLGARDHGLHQLHR
jgi:hypothetical protein